MQLQQQPACLTLSPPYSVGDLINVNGYKPSLSGASWDKAPLTPSLRGTTGFRGLSERHSNSMPHGWFRRAKDCSVFKLFHWTCSFFTKKRLTKQQSWAGGFWLGMTWVVHFWWQVSDGKRLDVGFWSAVLAYNVLVCKNRAFIIFCCFHCFHADASFQFVSSEQNAAVGFKPLTPTWQTDALSLSSVKCVTELIVGQYPSLAILVDGANLWHVGEPQHAGKSMVIFLLLTRIQTKIVPVVPGVYPVTSAFQILKKAHKAMVKENNKVSKVTTMSLGFVFAGAIRFTKAPSVGKAVRNVHRFGLHWSSYVLLYIPLSLGLESIVDGDRFNTGGSRSQLPLETHASLKLVRCRET